MNARHKLIYRDAHFWAAHKPCGIATYQETRGSGALGLKEVLEEETSQRLFPVHRIDADTSGLVLFALDSRSAAALIRLFKDHQVRKTYLAWCVGQLPKEGSIRTPLRKNKSDLKESAVTDYVRTQVRGNFSLAQVFPTTGRFHQIRRHFDSIGHALVGDPKYGKHEAWKSFFQAEPRLMLQAESVEFTHPFSRKPVFIKTKEKF